MKKSIAIAFLCLQVFTICGHILLYQYFVYQSDKLFNDQISKNRYNINDLVEIKVPLQTQMVQSWAMFENISGQIQFKNTCYNYVKLRLTRDAIYLKCIPNYETTKLFNQNIINAREIPDIPVNKKDHVPYGKTINLGNYNFPLALFKFVPPISVLHSITDNYRSHPVECCISIPGQPPKC